MKRIFSITILTVAAVATAWGQLVTSHAPTTVSAPTMALSPTPTVVGKPVARVNGAVLTDRDLLREMYTIFPYARQHNGVPKAMEADIRAGAMKMIVFEELVYQEAKRRNLTVPPAQLQRAEVAFRKQFSSPQQYQDLLNSEFKGSRKLLEAKIERSLLIEQLLKSDVEDRSFVSIVQARAFYDKNAQRFSIPESFSVQTISIIPPASVSDTQAKEARKKAEDALRHAKATRTYDEFGLLAEKISEDDYRVIMGDHQAVDRTKLPPEVLKAVETMQVGQISDLVDIGNHGYTILRLNAHTPAGQRKFEEVKDPVRTQLKKQKAEELRSALDKRLRRNAKVEEL